MRKPIAVAALVLLCFGTYTFFPGLKTTLAKWTGVERQKGEGHVEGMPKEEQEVACLDVEPKPVWYKFNDPNFPTGKLGDWYDVKNEQGQTILRVKVDVVDAIAMAGIHKDVNVRALFRLTLDNLTCHPFEWDVLGTQGIWYGYRPKSKVASAQSGLSG